MTVTLRDGETVPVSTNTRDMAKWGFNGIPPGKQVGDQRNRGHILGAQLGGTNHEDLQAQDNQTLKDGGTLPADRWKDYENFVALERNANAPMMKQVEDEVANGVFNEGREVQYTVDLTYDDSSEVPSNVNINAQTIDGDPPVSINESIPNVPRPDESGYTLFDRSSVNWS
ncbi:DNA/RNA non-specific endonuclease [Glycomyces harbinensis]|uniref:DNA/RNA non-specific endonuclease n=1 Tax=Glycomyces harbinensis TaxID=58114 RepID=A0A1G6Y5A6_9ACTN|nr:DNA/RNA non-specific endonuclease [Glycomyces harbinensis]SDD85588.1 DNA/RNA non-specific endonuclease [Glycomyces harbinensis]